MDFGLARRDEGEITVTVDGQVLGTPAYMSPEQARGEGHRVDGRSDVYSLGVILYELLAGELPFRGNSRMLVHQVLNDEPRPLRKLNDRIPRDLETITLKCMAKEPARRYGSAADLADDLRRYLNGEPILARPVSTLARTWRWSQRHPGAASAVVAVLAALFVLAVAVVVVLGKNQELATANVKLDITNEQLATSNEQLKKANEAERDAKQAAEGKQKEAEKARDETKQVLDYLVAAFRKPDPDADGEKLTVAELFDQAAEQLDTTFPNEPLIQAQLLNAIGETYRGLGLYQKSVAIHERARDLRRNEFGEDHKDTLLSMSALGMAYESAGRLAEALALLEQTVIQMKAKLGPEHPSTLTSINGLAEAYYATGRLEEALPLFKETLELRKGKLGLEHPDTLESMNNLAVAYEAAGRMADAVRIQEQTLELSKSKLSPEHPDTLRSMNNLAAAYISAGRLADALLLFEQTLALMKLKLGAEHPDTLITMNNLAETYHSAGRPEDALPLFEQALELRKAKLGLEHPDTLGSMYNLAYVFRFAGRLSDALPLYEQTTEAMKTKLGPEHPSTLTSMNGLAEAYYAAGRSEEALPLFKETLELRKANLGPEHPDTLDSMGNLAKVYLVSEQSEKAQPLFDRFIASHRERATPDDVKFAGLLAEVSFDLLQHRQYPVAETYLRECLTIREKKLPDDWVLFNTKSLLGGALAGQHKFQEAEPLVVEGYSGMKEREAKIPPAAKPRLTEALERLGRLYDAWGKPDEAAKWRAKLPIDSKPPGKEPEARKPPAPPSNESAKPIP